MKILKRVTAFILTFIMLLQEVLYGDIVLYADINVLTYSTYNAANHLICYNGKEITYDADGNMLETPVEGELTTLQYDCRNRLTKAGTTTYKYDAENIRIQSVSEEKTIEYVTDTTGSLSKVLVEYEYGTAGKEESAGEEVTQSELTDTTIYVYGNGLISQESEKGYYTYHYNNLGSTTRITDEFTNNVETFTYGTYGELLNGTTAHTHYLYNGQYGVSTEDNGLYYMRQRYYNPEIKRFINQDVVTGSINNSQSLNRYCYVQGNPVSLIDPFGLFPLSPNNLDHTVLGLLGMVPVVGILADAVDCGLYIKEGDAPNAIMSGISIVPIIGSFAASKLVTKFKKAKKTGNVVQKTTNAIEETTTFLSKTADVSKYGDEAIEIVAKGSDDALELALDATTDIAKRTDLTTEVVRKADLENGVTGKFVDNTLKYKEVENYTAEEVNQWFIDNVKPDYKPPYKSGTIVKEIELLEDATLVRTYDNMPGGSGMYGGWLMKAEDIEGLTAKEIQDKFALPNMPKYVCDVKLDVGTHLRMGEVNPLDGWGCGGGIQYDLIGQRVGEFMNERVLGGI